MENKKYVKIIIVVLLVVIMAVVGCLVYDRMIYKQNKIFKNVKNEENLKLIVKDNIPYEVILVESDNQEMIKEIIKAFDGIKVKRNTEHIDGGAINFVISNDKFRISFGLSGLLYVNGKVYDVNINSGDQKLYEVIDSILEKYGFNYKDKLDELLSNPT